jgi:hypothetical protein
VTRSGPFLLAVVFSCCALAQDGAALVEKLREGGYVLYLRHTSRRAPASRPRAIRAVLPR